MKKLKIFLLLSILLCFGFALSPEVHAQGVGPKIFEVGDVLPAGNIKISWDFSEKDNDFFASFYIGGSPSFHFNIDVYDDNTYRLYIPGGPTTNPEDLVGYAIITLESDITITVIRDDDDILYFETIGDALWWEVVPPDPKIFEVGDVLPQGIIRVSWDETTWYKMPEVFGQPDSGHQIKSSNNSFNFVEKIGTNYYVGGIPVMYIPEPGYLEFYPPYTVYGEGHAYVDINTAGWDLAKRTISTVIWSDWELVTSRLYWEDITPDGYTQGYQAAKEYYGWEDDGYWYTGEEAWDMGNEYARGIYGYYDPITDQWLSVSEYLELYGTDKPGQSDFYNNFDKYFIPAMIIVFGGAIVLTILKVFKGRE